MELDNLSPRDAKYLFFRKIVGGKSSKSMFVSQENEDSAMLHNTSSYDIQ